MCDMSEDGLIARGFPLFLVIVGPPARGVGVLVCAEGHLSHDELCCCSAKKDITRLGNVCFVEGYAKQKLVYLLPVAAL